MRDAFLLSSSAPWHILCCWFSASHFLPLRLPVCSLAPFSALSSHSIKELDISSLTFPRAVSMKHYFPRSYEYSVWYINWTYYIHKGLTAKKQHVFSLLIPQSKKQCFKLVLLFHYFYHIHLLYYKINIFFKVSLLYTVFLISILLLLWIERCIICRK